MGDTLLQVLASPRLSGSSSRRLAAAASAAWLAAATGRRLVVRDLAADPPDVVDAAWVAANYTAPDQRDDAMRRRLAASDRLIDETRSATHLLWALPMYNFSVPATLKAYIDQICRIGRTFARSPEGVFAGLLPPATRALVVVTSSTDWEHPVTDGREDHCGPYLGNLLGFLGIDDVLLVNVAYQLREGPSKEEALMAGEARLRALMAEW